MSLYLDTSCLWKLLVSEPGSAETRTIVEAEPRVVVSSLSELEVEVNLRALLLGGGLRQRRHDGFIAKLVELRDTPPLVHQTVSLDLVRLALEQARTSSGYCRTLDRLHLAAMEALGIQRLLTNDDQQAAAARALGFGVVLPR